MPKGRSTSKTGSSSSSAPSRGRGRQRSTVGSRPSSQVSPPVSSSNIIEEPTVLSREFSRFLEVIREEVRQDISRQAGSQWDPRGSSSSSAIVTSAAGGLGSVLAPTSTQSFPVPSVTAPVSSVGALPSVGSGFLLGALPNASALASVLGSPATLSSGAIVSSAVTTAATSVAPSGLGGLLFSGLPVSSLSTSVTNVPPTSLVTQSGGLSLSLSAPPVPEKLVTRIRSGQFVEMRDLLGDNVALTQHFESVNSSLPVLSVLPASNRPRLREVSSLPSWVYCFLTYMAVHTSDQATREWLVYARLIVREALLHGGRGWLDYDRLFRQQVAVRPYLAWNSLHPELMSSTVWGQRSGGGTFCTICQGFDHQSFQCAMAYLRQPTRHDSNTGFTSKATSSPHQSQAICFSWNEGQCHFYPNRCFRLHHCATCGSTQHRARDCKDTPPDSRYKLAKRGRASGPPPPSSSVGL